MTTLPDGQQMLMEPVTGQFPQVTPGTVQPGPLTQPPGPGYMYAAPPGTEAAPGPGYMYAVPTATEPVPTELPADAAPGPGYVFAAPEGVPPGAMYAAPVATEVPPGAMYAAPAATEVPPGAMYAAPEGAMYAAPAATEVPPGAMYAAPAATEGAPMMYAAPLGEGSEGQPAPAPMLGQTIMGNTYQAEDVGFFDVLCSGMCRVDTSGSASDRPVQSFLSRIWQVKIPVDSMRDESGATMTPLAWIWKLSS